MSDTERNNPYDEEESPELQAAWAEGARDGREGKAIEEQVYDDTEKFGAYIDGYRAATVESDE